MPRPLGYTQAIKCPIVELIPPTNDAVKEARISRMAQKTNVVEDGWTKKYVRTNLVVSKGLRKHWSKCPGCLLPRGGGSVLKGTKGRAARFPGPVVSGLPKGRGGLSAAAVRNLGVR